MFFFLRLIKLAQEAHFSSIYSPALSRISFTFDILYLFYITIHFSKIPKPS